ncbi:hypothetical protein GO279_04876 [Ralstonia solanacearum]|nr:hypothetical protein [Ralstonia solanacearum]NKA86359.1 hypothetical protein [Ralstonia solanacearum]NKF57778.1 hypothetical protein [Ralstonia solanacearum]NKF62714.1 hypothetical protein [Ralstonia solanacearum]NKF67685.1 hypothetical protein [Ralstonia solanacearum]
MILPSPLSWPVVTLRFRSLPMAPPWFASEPVVIATLPPLPASLPILPEVLSSEATLRLTAPLPRIEPPWLITAAPDWSSVRLLAADNEPVLLFTDCAVASVRSWPATICPPWVFDNARPETFTSPLPPMVPAPAAPPVLALTTVAAVTWVAPVPVFAIRPLVLSTAAPATWSVDAVPSASIWPPVLSMAPPAVTEALPLAWISPATLPRVLPDCTVTAPPAATVPPELSTLPPDTDTSPLPPIRPPWVLESAWVALTRVACVPAFLMAPPALAMEPADTVSAPLAATVPPALFSAPWSVMATPCAPT